ncbi:MULTISPECIES: hypothetical protein [Bacillaceae]|uniref:hypothetical protein n=1 Tax=Bacillaceae TaxID=186817 RepID=UPI002964DB8F|nr:hypothetical protein [Bacillus infantis]MDW2879555.1 hypothetical protein [Bacillus infantis]
MFEDKEWDSILYGMVKHLKHYGEMELAGSLLSAELEIGAWIDEATIISTGQNMSIHMVNLKVEEQHFKYIKDNEDKIEKAFEIEIEKYDSSQIGFIPKKLCLCSKIKADLVDWRQNELATLAANQINNQGNIFNNEAQFNYNGLRYRSKSEIEIAKEFDKRGILFFPLPACVIEGISKEPDFLVNHPNGKWGILECNGDPYHTFQNSTKDHEKVRLFMKKGIPVIFFNATDCYNQPSKVVDDFMEILGKN